MTERTRPTPPSSPEVRPVALDAGGVTLSGLVAEPAAGPPRATLVALHGGGMRADYFDGRAHPDLSLLTLAAGLGHTVLALDRPGYGLSAPALPQGLPLAEQATTVQAALKTFAAGRSLGAGVLLVGHSYGGKLALTAAAAWEDDDLIGLDVSGCGHRYAADPGTPSGDQGHGSRKQNWGSLRFYPGATFRPGGFGTGDRPPAEVHEARLWPGMFPATAARVRVPVRVTFAEEEHWWRHDEESVASLVAAFTSTGVRVDRQPDAGHNISLGWAARSYHLRVLAFAEECLLRRGHRPAAGD
ncbi:alpha/beta fold hydrolase [Streptomyces sp. SCUT-3]|uniref:alpha/beta hydrolase n=1 Tax=Streptomyces TaxID=1883 RepID=UPI000CB8429D|nr:MULTISPECIES: alpha/beta hydrolase [unclassified Streptomyces]MCZ2526411.1 alpha/beta fold hydrolase [Streptomyces sp. HB2AG]PLW73037.1 alpha/beta hydrolase [Streptomyces sp. DJ]QMV24505.1 alpha/beta fold hydrolase [Streptomyces sp. SCUT-3]